MADYKESRNYQELSALPTFLERYRYLRLGGAIGEETFGYDRYLNQVFYHSKEWKEVRNAVIVRDEGCDLGVPGQEIGGRIYIHHMNPITLKDIDGRTDYLLNPAYLICCSKRTHDAIHYGDESILFTGFPERKPNDTCPWK